MVGPTSSPSNRPEQVLTVLVFVLGLALFSITVGRQLGVVDWSLPLWVYVVSLLVFLGYVGYVSRTG